MGCTAQGYTFVLVSFLYAESKLGKAMFLGDGGWWILKAIVQKNNFPKLCAEQKGTDTKYRI